MRSIPIKFSNLFIYCLGEGVNHFKCDFNEKTINQFKNVEPYGMLNSLKSDFNI